MKKNLIKNLVMIVIGLNCAFITKSQANKSNYVLTDVSIIDVEKGSIMMNKTMIINAGIIQKITSNVNDEDLSGRIKINGKGLFVIPGLFDSHVHYVDPETFGLMLISNGVLFVREMGNVTEVIINQRNLLNNGKFLGPEMISTGAYLDGKPPFIPQISLSCSTPDEGREMVNKQIKAGVDQIKTFSRLKKDVFYAIVDECKKNKIKVVGHVPETIYIEDAAKAGLNCSEHLFGFGNVIAKALGQPEKLQWGGMGADQDYFLKYNELDRGILQLELKKINSYGMAVCPTMIVWKCGTNLNEIFNQTYPMLDYISPMVWGMWKQMWEPQKAKTEFFKQLYPNYIGFLKDLYDAQFTLLIGTDLLVAGVIPGYSVHEEMAIWHDAGIPVIDILRSATITPAKFIGVDKSFGTIEEGKKASFVILRDNPLSDIKNTQKIEGVFIRGEFFDRQKLDTLKMKVKEANETKYRAINASNQNKK